MLASGWSLLVPYEIRDAILPLAGKVAQLGVSVNQRSEPSLQDLHDAREAFVSLAAGRTPEAVWQKFFAKHPFVLSRALPFRLLPCDIVPLGRPGRSEPDFLMHPGSENSARIHGVIELKANRSRILSRPRRNVLKLSDNAATAVRQVETYDALYDSYAPTKRTLALETLSHLIIIMGHAGELLEIEESLLPQIPLIIPAGVRFIGYDELLASYSRDLPKPSFILYPNREPSAVTVQAWLDGPRTMVQNSLVHRVVTEGYSSFAEAINKPSPSYGYFFRHWITTQFDRAPWHPCRFQPRDLPVIYGCESFEDEVAEALRHEDTFPHSLGETRDRHLAFEYSGSMLDMSALMDVKLAGDDPEPSIALATAARDRGFDGIIYKPPQRQARMAAIFRQECIGRLVKDEIIYI